GLKPGDMLLFADGLTNAGWVRVRSVTTTQTPANTTHVQWDDPLYVTMPVDTMVFRKRLSVFGANAPMWATMSSTFQDLYKTAVGENDDVTDWPFFTIGEFSMTVDIDGSQPDIVVGDYLMLVTFEDQHLFQVEDVEELSRAAFSLSGKVTRVTLFGNS